MKSNDVLRIAADEFGYIGKKSNADLDDKTANITGKFTKYARDLNAAGYYNGDKNGFAWCCVFVDWCFYVAAGRDKAAATKVKPVSLYGASVRFITPMFPEDHIYQMSTAPGDQVIFKNAATGELTHTGLVESVSGDTFTTIEGNVKDRVTRRTFSINDPSIYAFVRPYYDADEITITNDEYQRLLKDSNDLRIIRGIING